MDRRDFLKTAFSFSLITPLLAAERPSERDLTCYLIGDHPERYLPSIVEEIAGGGSARSGRFSFINSHPFAHEIKSALARNGWSHTSQPAASSLRLSFEPLRHHAAPSFTLVQNTKVRDIRGRGLYRLWQEMNAFGPMSTCLTVVSLRPVQPSAAPGRAVAIYADGQRKERLALTEDQRKRYATASGEIVIGIERGTARVLAATCRHKICQAALPASRAGERIICAPGRFLLEIEGPRLVDTVTG
jgi:hypothetical protein